MSRQRGARLWAKPLVCYEGGGGRICRARLKGWPWVGESWIKRQERGQAGVGLTSPSPKVFHIINIDVPYRF